MTIDVIITHKTVGSDKVAVAQHNGQRTIIEPGEHARFTLHDGNELKVTEERRADNQPPAPEAPAPVTDDTGKLHPMEPGAAEGSHLLDQKPEAQTINAGDVGSLDGDAAASAPAGLTATADAEV